MSDVGLDAGADVGLDVLGRLSVLAGSGGTESAVVVVAYYLTGTGTAWSGTPFSLVSAGSAVVALQVVIDSTHAVIQITPNGNPGPYTISDGVATFSLPVLMLTVGTGQGTLIVVSVSGNGLG